VPRQEAAACRGQQVGSADRLDAALQPGAGTLQFVAQPVLVDQQRDAGVALEVGSVAGELREQQQRRAIGQGGELHQRGIGAAIGVEGRERGGLAFADEALDRPRRVERVGCG